MRVFIPATLKMLETLVADGAFDAVSRTAFAVTPTLREAYASGDDDELAEVAMGEAARASLRLLAAEIDDADDGAVGAVDTSVTEKSVAESRVQAVHRRAVIAADVDSVKLRPDLDDAVVRLTKPVTMDEVAAVHVDLAEAEEAVRKAIAVVDAADMGDPDAEFVIGDAEDHTLAWYAVQELPFLLDLL